MSWRQHAACRARWVSRVVWMAANCSAGVRPSGGTCDTPAMTNRRKPATRIIKNSSRFFAKIAKNLTRSSNGWEGWRASSRTRQLNWSQLSSRLIYRDGSSKAGVARAVGRSDDRWSVSIGFPLSSPQGTSGHAASGTLHGLAMALTVRRMKRGSLLPLCKVKMKKHQAPLLWPPHQNFIQRRYSPHLHQDCSIAPSDPGKGMPRGMHCL